jgi:hypothetical protein
MNELLNERKTTFVRVALATFLICVLPFAACGDNPQFCNGLPAGTLLPDTPEMHIPPEIEVDLGVSLKDIPSEQADLDFLKGLIPIEYYNKVILLKVDFSDGRRYFEVQPGLSDIKEISLPYQESPDLVTSQNSIDFTSIALEKSKTSSIKQIIPSYDDSVGLDIIVPEDYEKIKDLSTLISNHINIESRELLHRHLTIGNIQ